ncbi:MAG: hypothetical protein ACI9R3_003580, partial [Verrucomicrobiales bacterium]
YLMIGMKFDSGGGLQAGSAAVDHGCLPYRFQGHDYRLTDVRVKLLKKVIA